MKNLILKLTWLILLISLSGRANEPQGSDSMTVHFQGAIVEEPCQINNSDGSVAITCWNEQEKQTLQYTLVKNQPNKGRLFNDRGNYYVTWKNENVAIINVNYD